MAQGAKALQLKPAAEPDAAKRPKTGGRVKKPLDQLLAEARMRNEIAIMNDDTTLPEELAALYLCMSASELAELRKPQKPSRTAAVPKSAQVARPTMLKPIREGAVGQNQKINYKLGHLRAYQESIAVKSSFEAAVKGGIYGFMSVHAPFFAQISKRSDRGRTILVAKAWDKLDPEWAKRFKQAVDGKLRAVWLTPAEAASSQWTTVAGHKALAKLWLAALKDEKAAVKAAIEATEISQAAP